MEQHLRDQIKQVADEVRYWAECTAPSLGHDEESLSGMCAIASAELWKKLRMRSIHGTLHVAEHDWGSHAFLIIDDHVVCVTGTQFPEFRNQPVVIIHSKEAEVHEYYQSMWEFMTPKELREWQQRYRWPKNQTATA